MEINYQYYEEKTYDEYKDASLEELERVYAEIDLYSSNGKGQTATVPGIKMAVIDKLIKERKKNGL